VLKKNNQQVIGFVIMPNHLHVILYFPEPGYSLNKIIGNAKRFMAYEIIKRLEDMKRNDLLEFLFGAVTKREKKKAQRHKVFEESFDAKGINSEKFLLQKLNYIHRNPVSGNWKLVKDFTEYEHSSASFYETGKIKTYEPFDFRKL
jgi:REP element-mobilizing transposase RayT